MLRLCIMLLLSCFHVVAATPWYPVSVVQDGVVTSYQPLSQAKRPWRLCILLPHGKDHYWWGVAWGLSEEASRLGVQIGIYEAGGYEFLDKQRQQLKDCVVKKADAYIIAAISAAGLETEISQLAAKGIPVIDLINGIESEAILSHSVVSFREMTTAALDYIFHHNQLQSFRLGWFPGPEGAGWVSDAETGLWKRLQGEAVELLHAGYAPTDGFRQATLTRTFYQQYNKVDYVLANAVAAKKIAQLHEKQPQLASPIIAFYANPDVMTLLKHGKISAAVTDSPVVQARIAVDLAVRSLQGEVIPKRVSPEVIVLTQEQLAGFDLRRLLPPDDQWMLRRALLDDEQSTSARQNP